MKKLHTILMSVALAFSASSLASSEEVSTHGNALESSLWTITNIPVCWENFDEIPAEEQEWVKNAVADTWEAESSVKFTGWGACSTDSPGIHILVADSASAPHVKRIGKNLDGYTNGMVLNHTYSTWSTSCQWRKQYCSEVIAVHEFGHALGFVHEQNRPDTPETCTDAPQGTNGDLYVGEWDIDSIMNYCNPTWNNAGILSETDIEMVSLFYGESNDVVHSAPVDICDVTATSDDGNVAANTLDGNLDTRWSANGELERITFTLCEPTSVDRVDLAWFKGDQRQSYFDYWYTLPTGTTYFPSGGQRTSSGTTTALETEILAEKEISQLTIRGFGNSSNTWNSLTEAVIYSVDTLPEYPELNLPTNLTVELNGSDIIELSWTDNSTDEDGYVIEAQVDGADFEIVATTAANSTSFTHTGLQLFGTYNYRVTAFSGILRSNFAATSIEREDPNGNVLNKPTNFTATVTSDNTIIASWTDTNDSEDGYSLDIDAMNPENDGALYLLGADVESYETLPLEPGTYTVAVYARLGYNTTVSEAASLTLTIPEEEIVVLAKPTNFVAEVTGAGSVEVTWVDNAVAENGYVIERRDTGSQDYNATYSFQADRESYTITHLSPGSYDLRIHAYNAEGISEYAELTIDVPSTADVITPEFVEASSDDGNVATNVLDGDYSTRWSAKGEGESLTFHLGEDYNITDIRIAWYKGNERQTSYRIEVSEDNYVWSQVHEGISSGESLSLETTISGQRFGKYVRVIGLGNTNNTWNSITEVSIKGYIFD